MRWVAVVVVLLCMGTVELQAQTRADSAAVLLNTVEQLRMRGEAAAARALLNLIAEQYGGTPAAREVGRLLALLGRMPEAERSGRTELLVFATGYGAWLGLALPLAAESDRPEAYGIGLLLGAPAGFLAARHYTNRQALTYGQARAITFGGTWGTYQGIGLAELFEWGGDTETFCDPDACYEVSTDGDESTFIVAAVAGGLAGIGTGLLLARKPITAGTAATVTLGGMWGTWFGFGLSYLAGLDGNELLGATMLSGNASLLALGVLAPRWQLGESRARVISLGGLIGGLAGAGALLLIQPDDERSAIAVPLVTSALGLSLAARWTRMRDESPQVEGRGALINRSGGRWSVDMPNVSLRLQPGSGVNGAAYVPLLRASF